MPPNPLLVAEANYRQLLDDPPNVVVLPWGATEAHNYHLPHGTDNYEAEAFARRAAELAAACGAKVAVLPGIPFGNNEQQLDQVATISFSTATAAAILNDVARSLKAQGIDRLLIVNNHGGNEFKPLVRDATTRHGMLIAVANTFQMMPLVWKQTFEETGGHADEMETSLILHLRPDLVALDQAGPGDKRPFELKSLEQPGVWTPRPWSKVHPDTGHGDPTKSTAEKGERFFEAVAAALADVVVELSAATKGQLPYV